MSLLRMCLFLTFLCGLLFSVDAVAPLRYSVIEQLMPETVIGNIKDQSGLASRRHGEHVTLAFLGHNPHQHLFVIDETSGQLETNDVLDRDAICPGQEICEIKLDFAVQPAEFFEKIAVIVTVQDINDNRPTFSESHVTQTLSESTAPGVLFPIEPATDLDSPANGIDRYELLTGTEFFKLQVKKEFGVIGDINLVLKKALDREKQAMYSLKLVAYDKAPNPKSGSVLINITILDENDNSPRFTKTVYEVEVLENRTQPLPILRVEARDADIGLNGIVRYSFSNKTDFMYSGLFSIHRTTGDISLLKPLDYEEQDMYSLGIVAIDQGLDPVKSSAKVLIRVLDINDNDPRIVINLEEGQDVIQVPENGPDGMFVAHISVLDPDSDENGQVSCSLTESAFILEEMYEKEYKIVTAYSLDREDHAVYNVLLECHDHGTPKRYTSGSIPVEVLDVNDHSPEFTHAVYHAELQENNKMDALVIDISANDRDAGDNGAIRYFLDQDAGDAFVIDPESGRITTKVRFDREQIQNVEFHVIAQDGSDSPTASKALVVLTILDVDDERPQFTRSNFEFQVYENLPARSEIGRVIAVDGDAPKNAEFSFYLDAQHSAVDKFSIDPETGSVWTKEPLDREELDAYVLKVIVQSDNLPHKGDTTIVNIVVLDKNDHAPMIIFPSEKNNTVQLTQGVPVGYMVTRVQAFDPDYGNNARLTYQVSEGNTDGFFVMEPNSGELYVNKNIDDVMGTTYRLILMVRDNGASPKISVTSLILILNSTVVIGNHYMISQPPTSGLSEIYIIIIACSIIVVIIVALTLLIALITMRRRRKHGTRGDDYSARSDLVATSMAAPNPVEPCDITEQDRKVTELPDVTLTPNPDDVTKTVGHAVGPSERDSDSGCADVSQASSHGSEDDASSQAGNRSSWSEAQQTRGPALVLKCCQPKNPNEQSRSGSFSDWVQAENYNLKQRGHVYHVSNHVKKCVRFSEPVEDQQYHSETETEQLSSLPVDERYRRDHLLSRGIRPDKKVHYSDGYSSNQSNYPSKPYCHRNTAYENGLSDQRDSHRRITGSVDLGTDLNDGSLV